MTATATRSTLSSITQLEAELNTVFYERREVIHGALCAVLAGEHVLLLGPAGTGKSAIVRAIAQAFGGTYFERLLTKFSTPEELFGPISLSALEQDRYERITAGKLPEAHFAFADEVFKGNSAILNSLLALVNERIFHNDGAVTQVPLVSFFGASNELPEGKELEAFFDRFLLRYDVQYLLRPSAVRAMVTSTEPAVTTSLCLAELAAAQKDVRDVTITDATIDALLAIREAARGEGITVSDRRWKKTLPAVQANAYLAGEAATCPEDLLILSDSLWREPEGAPRRRPHRGQGGRPHLRPGAGGARRCARDRCAARRRPAEQAARRVHARGHPRHPGVRGAAEEARHPRLRRRPPRQGDHH